MRRFEFGAMWTFGDFFATHRRAVFARCACQREPVKKPAGELVTATGVRLATV